MVDLGERSAVPIQLKGHTAHSVPELLNQTSFDQSQVVSLNSKNDRIGRFRIDEFEAIENNGLIAP